MDRRCGRPTTSQKIEATVDRRMQLDVVSKLAITFRDHHGNPARTSQPEGFGVPAQAPHPLVAVVTWGSHLQLAGLRSLAEM